MEKVSCTHGNALGQTNDLSEVLRYTGLASARVPNMDIAASGGIADGAAMVKALLAGASAVEVCSALYWQGSEGIQKMLVFLSEWMERHGYESISQFRGRLNAKEGNAMDKFERTQFFNNFSLRND